MSPRAACRLERLGFDQVYDYVGGIGDWKAAGLTVEGSAAHVLTVADATRSDVPTCTPEDVVGDVRQRTIDEGWNECIVVDCDGIVVGRLRNQAWDATDEVTVESAMESGPTTVRPNTVLHPLVERMNDRETNLIVVATPQGELLGVLLRTDAQRLLSGEPPEQIWQDCDGCPGRWALAT